MSDEIELIKRKASYQDMEPREYCIYKIQEWKTNLEKVSKDYRELSHEQFEKAIENEIE